MGAGSKRKGAAFERKVAKLFEQETGIRLTRTPLSGGWGKLQTKGDLIPTHPEEDTIFGHSVDLFIECKKVEGWSAHNFFMPNNDDFLVEKWWEKACEQAAEEDKRPVLVLGQNFMPILVRYKNPEIQTRIQIYPHARMDDGSYIANFEVFLAYLAAYCDRKKI